LDNVFVGDFETTTNIEDCRVWGWGLYDINLDRFLHGTNITSFFNRVFTLNDTSKIYFHNLKFDGEFIFYYLFENGFTHTTERKLQNKQFSSLITNMGVFYSITIMYNNKQYTIMDSMKIIPLPVSKMSKAFNIAQIKGEIDYEMERPIGYKLSENEIAYLKNDVEIVGKSLLYFFNQGLNKMTQAGNSMADYKKIATSKKFKLRFPQLTMLDFELRQSYKGGFTYVNPKYKDKDIDEGIVLDVNSLYPAVMYYCMLPFGEPILYQGKYEKDKLYTIYIQMIRCNFELKEGFLPTIQLKNNPRFSDTEYVTSSDNLDITLYLTSVDLELFLEHYNVSNIEYIRGWKFKATNIMFKDYIDKWVAIKNEGTITKNEGIRTIAKLMLNALYGKFGVNPKVQSKIPIFKNGLVHYVLDEENERDLIYLPIATFVTAYARQITISSGQKNYDRFIYADTDSLHLLGQEEPENLNIDNVKMGCWKIESKFTRARFVRSKSYIEEIEGELHIACAGMPKQCHKNITFDNFKVGLKVGGKLQHNRVRGGVVLKNIDFTLKM